MQVFVVFGLGSSQAVQGNIVKSFPNDYLTIDSTTFLVACQGMTAQQLATVLGMGDEVALTGIVVPIHTYWGRHNTNTWEWISVKSQSR